MKFWEALKAVDEGKTVQFKHTENSNWVDWKPSLMKDWSTNEVNQSGYELRIKPEPRIIYLNEFKNTGFQYSFVHSSKEAADKAAAFNKDCIRLGVKFVEVMEENNEE